jgi:hypothetical protein
MLVAESGWLVFKGRPGRHLLRFDVGSRELLISRAPSLVLSCPISRRMRAVTVVQRAARESRGGRGV